MRGTDVLKMLLSGSFNMIDERLSAVTDREWSERAIPGTSKPGFILWHCARILDWTIHSAIEGVPEVADSPKWQARFPREAFYGAGIPGAVADQVTDATSKADTIEYLHEVKPAVMAWFGRQNEETLDTITALKSNQQKHPGYLDPDVWAAVEDLDGLPWWQLLARPSGAHIRRHAGEYDVLMETLRARTSAR